MEEVKKVEAKPVEIKKTEAKPPEPKKIEFKPAKTIPEPVKVVEPEPKKEYQEPKLMIEEVARKFKQFKPHHLASLLSFCQSRGFPIIGTETEMLNTLKAFGWQK